MKKICLIDDSSDFTFLLEMMLRQSYEIVSLFSGAEAIDYLQDQPCQLLLIDYFLPDMSGEALIKMIRSKGVNKETPALLLTAKDVSEISDSAEFCCKISKKIIKQQILLEKIKSCLE
ncbi:MAG TPA: response regulator [Candidatus Marinimicrobia bacterium]|nr:response regulator [Candidatus Neomarinimicrobiota bacterium]